MPSPKPKPTKIKKLHGSQKCRINKNEPEPTIDLSAPPDHLDDVAIKEWHRLGNELYECGLMTRVDYASFAAYCVTWARWVEAEEIIAKEGFIITTTHGNIIQHPAVGVANKALELMHRFLTEFGMTPSSRAKVTVSEKALNKFEKYGF